VPSPLARFSPFAIPNMVATGANRCQFR
jgi:hypothetical protein